VFFALGLLAALAPGTLSLDYRLEPAGRLTISWTTSAASGRLTRQLTPEDNAALASLAGAVASPGEEWRPLSNRAADLLLSGIEPLGGVRRVIIHAPGEPLRRIPFEVLGSPPLIERFAVWYEPASTPSITRLWPIPDAPSAAFMNRYERELQGGLAPAEALRKIKVEYLRSGGERAHPFYWAPFVLHGSEAAGVPARVIPWVWIAGTVLLLGSAAFFIWWRRRRFELW
jgi:hypothetical protein